MHDYAGLDYQKLSDLVDIVSWDAYPFWHSAPDARIAAECALQHDRMRSIRKGPFLLMESALSSTNWQPVSVLKGRAFCRLRGCRLWRTVLTVFSIFKCVKAAAPVKNCTALLSGIRGQAIHAYSMKRRKPGLHYNSFGNFAVHKHPRMRLFL